MTDWMGWFGIAGLLVVLEMFTGTFYLLMIGFGFTAGGLAALSGAGPAVQLIIAGAVGVVATYGLRRSKWGRSPRPDAASDPNVNLDIGQVLVVDAWSGTEGETRTARAMYRGALWDVELDKRGIARAGTFVIREVRGSRLIVTNSGSR
ncbi:NfeD family protein [Noviherbaspirillum agri]